MSSRSTAAGSIAVQSVLFLNAIPELERVLAALKRVSEWLALNTDVRLVVAWGDSSPRPIYSTELIESWKEKFGDSMELSYEYFGENLGHGGGQNRLAAGHDAEYIVFANPDLMQLPDALAIMHACLQENPSIGIVDGRQIPFEHPKYYDPSSGDTSWCSGAFSMVRASEFRQLGGFDHQSFFMHGDDVDLSWRYRLEGMRAVHLPSAVAYHDKRFDVSGRIAASPLEARFAPIAGLMLAHKYSRPDIVAELLRTMNSPSASPEHRLAVRHYRERIAEGKLPTTLDEGNKVGQFISGNYSQHRW